MPFILGKPHGKYKKIYCSTLLCLFAAGGQEGGVSKAIGSELDFSDFRNEELSIFHRLGVFICYYRIIVRCSPANLSFKTLQWPPYNTTQYV